MWVGMVYDNATGSSSSGTMRFIGALEVHSKAKYPHSKRNDRSLGVPID